MLLSALLMPLMLIGNNAAANARIKQLKNDLHAKEIELANIDTMIQEKEEFLDTMTSRGAEIYVILYKALNDEQKQIFQNEMDTFEKGIEQALLSKANIEEYFTQIFSNVRIDKRHDFERLRFVMIRYAVGCRYLEKLFKRYEQCLQQVQAIERDLESLQKQLSN